MKIDGKNSGVTRRVARLAALAAVLVSVLASAIPAAAVNAPQWVAALYIDGQRSVGLRWMAVPGATGYKVLRSEKSGADFKEIAAPAQPQHFDAAVEAGSTYFYVLQAVAGAEASPNSAEKSVAIPGQKVKAITPPNWTKLVLQDTTEFGKTMYRVGLFWDKVPDAIAYNLYRSTTSGKDFQLLTSSSENQAVDAAVEVGKTYYYVLTALDSNFLETPYSAEQIAVVEKKKETKAKKKVKLEIKPRATKPLWTKTKGDQNNAFGLWEPTDISLDEKDDLIYAVSNNTQEVYVLNATTGDIVRKFGKKGKEPGQFMNPIGTSVGPDGDLYVCDMGRGVVIRFSPDGVLRREYQLKPPPGVEMKGLAKPLDVAVDPKTSEIYVVENELKRIWVLADDGEFLRFVGEPGEGPGKIKAPLYIRFDRKGNVVVSDQQATQMTTFKTDGTWVRSWGERRAAVGAFLFIAGFDWDKEGNLIVLEKSAAMAQGFLEDGRYLFNLANEKGEGAAPIFSPKDIVIDSKNRAFICEGLVDRITALQITGPVPPPQEEPAAVE